MADERERISLRTPEQVEVSYELAGLGSRFLAGLIDTCVVGLFILVLSIVLGVVRAYLWDDPVQGVTAWAIVISAGVLIYIGYFVLYEMTQRGQSPGKRLTGLRVISTTGAPLSLEQSAVRNILRIVDMLPAAYTVALISILVTRRSQRLGDVASGAMVVKERLVEVAADELPVPDEGGTSPALPAEVTEEIMRAVRIGVRTVSYEEILTVRHFLDRRFELGPDARARLAEKLSQAIRPRITGLAPGQLIDPELLLTVVVRAVDEAR